MSETGFNEYQKQARSTAIYPADYAILYPALGLVNEAGEVVGKIKKVIRDNDNVYSEAKSMEIAGEIGDVLWYLAVLADDLGYTLEEIAQENLRKLQSRLDRGVLGGSGDNR